LAPNILAERTPEVKCEVDIEEPHILENLQSTEAGRTFFDRLLFNTKLILFKERKRRI
jgi:hypothetical protein